MSSSAGISFLGRPTQVEMGTHNGARNKPNEDRFTAFVAPGGTGQPAQFLIVADGVTSTHGGERASDIAVRVIQQALQAAQPTGRANKPLRDRMADAIYTANHEILEMAKRDPELKGMSTTLVVAAVDGDQLTVMHLGDSRAYLIRNGTAFQLTHDHTWVQEALDEGRITPEQARTHPNKHVILRYLGDGRGISIDQGVRNPEKPGSDADETEIGRQQVAGGDTAMTVRPGDALLLCSDGLYNRISEAEIAAAVTTYAPEHAVRSLIEQAVKRDEPDNITIVLWPTAPPVAAAAAKGRPKPLVAGALAAVMLVLVWLAFSVLQGTGGETVAAPSSSPAATEQAVAAAQSVTAASPEAVHAATDESTPAAASTEEPVETSAETTAEDPAGPAAAAETPAAVEETVKATETATPNPTATPLFAPTPQDAGFPPETATAVPAGAVSEYGRSTLTPAAAAPEATLLAADGTSTTAAGTLTALGVAGLPTTKPTSTSLPTSTAAPTGTPTATRTTAPPRTATPSPSVSPTANTAASPTADVAGGPTSATIKSPPDNYSGNQSATFSWAANAPLAAGQGFEVVFWGENETEDNARSWVGASEETIVLINLRSQAPGSYQWALYLVTREPYGRIRPLAGPYSLTIPQGSNPSKKGCDADEDGKGCS